MRVFRQLVIVVVVVASAQSQQSRIELCDLLRDADRYNRKEVTVRATLRYGFEWHDFFCLTCDELGSVWLAFPTGMDDGSMKAFERMPRGAGIVNVTVTGVFEAGGRRGYGHMNQYRYLLTPSKIRDVAVIQKGMKDLGKEHLAEQRYACGGSNPK